MGLFINLHTYLHTRHKLRRWKLNPLGISLPVERSSQKKIVQFLTDWLLGMSSGTGDRQGVSPEGRRSGIPNIRNARDLSALCMLRAGIRPLITRVIVSTIKAARFRNNSPFARLNSRTGDETPPFTPAPTPSAPHVPVSLFGFGIYALRHRDQHTKSAAERTIKANNEQSWWKTAPAWWLVVEVYELKLD